MVDKNLYKFTGAVINLKLTILTNFEILSTDLFLTSLISYALCLINLVKCRSEDNLCTDFNISTPFIFIRSNTCVVCISRSTLIII